MTGTEFGTTRYLFLIFYNDLGEDCDQKSWTGDQNRTTIDGEKPQGVDAAYQESRYVVAIDHVSLVRVGTPRGSLVEVKSTKVCYATYRTGVFLP